MKAVQIGILVALIVCAGLLFKIYRGQQSTPAPPVTAAALSTPVAAPAVVAPAAVEPAPAPVATPAAPEPPKPVVAKRKPSPARRPREQAQDAVVVAQNQPPAEPPSATPAPVAPPPAPPAEPPAPVTPAPAPGDILNPPSGTETAPPPPRTPHTVTIPAGTSVSVRLGETLSTDKNQAGDSFAATLDQPLVVDGFVIAERGARARGAVMESERAGRVSGASSLAVHLTRLHTSDGQDVTIQTEAFRKQGPTSKGEDAKKVGVGAAIGAAIGAIAGGGKGAAIGAGVGGAAGAGTVAATRGKPTELPVETRVTFRLQQPVTITERIQ